MEQTLVEKQTTEIVLANAKKFKDCIALVSGLVTEVTFNFTGTGLEVIAMDPANVAMVILKMPKSAFLKYEGVQKFDLNIGSLKEILKRSGTEDKITLTFGEGKCEIGIISKTTKKSFMLRLIELESKEQKCPELTYTGENTMKVKDIKEALSDIAVVADEAVTFDAQANKLVLIGKGDLNNAEVEITDGIFKEQGSAKYSTEYLAKMISNVGEKVKLQLKKDYPMMISYDLEGTSLQFILAPRVGDSDDEQPKKKGKKADEAEDEIDPEESDE